MLVTPSTVDPGVTAVEPGRPQWLYRGLRMKSEKIASTVASKIVHLA